MRIRWAFAVSVLLAITLSGCFGGKENSEGTPNEVPTGAVHGVVVDDEGLPIAGARVSVASAAIQSIQLSSTTGASGAFAMEKVPPGKKVISATKEGYHAASLPLTVDPGATVEQRLEMRRLPKAEARIAPFSAIEGRYDCAGEWVVGGGSCSDLVPADTGEYDPFTENADHNWTVPSGWGGILYEVTWQVGGQNQLIEGMRMEIKLPGGNETLASVESVQSPMRLILNRGEIHSGASTNETLDVFGGPVILTVRPVGTLAGATCDVNFCFGSGAGVALELQYTIYPTVFFGAKVDPDYSGL